MNFGRIFANALARRLAYVLVAALLAWCGMGKAQAQEYYETQGEAYAACAADMPAIVANADAANPGQFATGQWRCVVGYNTNPGSTNGWFSGEHEICSGPPPSGQCGYWWSDAPNHWRFAQRCPPEDPWEPVTHTCGVQCPAGQVENPVTGECGRDCSVASPSSGSCNASKGSQCTTACFSGCSETFSHTSPEDDYIVTEGPNAGNWLQGTWTETGAFCDVDDPAEPPECGVDETRQPDGSCKPRGDCPVGQHKQPDGSCQPDGQCPTGKIKAPDGSCVDEECPAGQVKGSDGTCKKDSDGDGDPDEGEDEGTFSGGETCDTPPACSGDNILCGQARIQWRIDCNTRKNRTVSGGNGCSPADVPICTGEKCDPVEYGAMLQAWRTRCAVEKLASVVGEDGIAVVGGGTGAGDADGDGRPDWTEVEGDGTGGEGEEPEGPVRTVGLNLSFLDTGGFGLARDCPQFGTLDFGVFGQWNLDDQPWFCTMVTAIFWTLQLLGIFLAIMILRD